MGSFSFSVSLNRLCFPEQLQGLQSHLSPAYFPFLLFSLPNPSRSFLLTCVSPTTKIERQAWPRISELAFHQSDQVQSPCGPSPWQSALSPAEARPPPSWTFRPPLPNLWFPCGRKVSRGLVWQGDPPGMFTFPSGLLFQGLLPGAEGTVGFGLEIQVHLLFVKFWLFTAWLPLGAHTSLHSESEYLSDAISGLKSTLFWSSGSA